MTFSLTAEQTNFNEGKRVTCSLQTDNVAEGTEYEYTISGCEAEDIVDGLLTGKATVNSEGKVEFSFGIVLDFKTEGNQNIKVSIGGQELTLKINDTSTNSSGDIYSLIPYKNDNIDNIEKQWLFSNNGVIYVSFDDSVNETKREWWKEVLIETESIIEPEFAIVDKNNSLSQVVIYEVSSLGGYAGMYTSPWNSYEWNGSEYEFIRGGKSQAKIEMASIATSHKTKFANNDESGWKHTAFHELGHALTLAHPHDNSNSNYDGLIDTNGTVMSYVNASEDDDGNPCFSELDKKALIYTYGEETGNIATSAAGTTLLQYTGSYLDNQRKLTPGLRMEFVGGNRVCEPTSGTVTKRIKFTRYDGYLGESADLAYSFSAGANLYWKRDTNSKQWYTELSLPTTTKRIEFQPGEDTAYLDITIYPEVEGYEDATEYISFYVYNQIDFREGGYPTSSNPITLYIDNYGTSSYSIKPSGSYVREGGNANFIIDSLNIAGGTKYQYTISGVSAGDISNNSLTGEIEIDNDSRTILSIPIKNDDTVEGNEELTLTIGSQTASITIFDNLEASSGGSVSEDTNSSPSNINLSKTSFNENIDDNSVVAVLSTIDADLNDTHTYSLIDGTGDTDNSSFTINGTSLKINTSPDFETKSSYNVRIQTVDSNNSTFAKTFTFNVIDLEDEILTPTYTLTSSSSSIKEGESITFFLQTENVDTDQILYWQVHSNYTDTSYNMTSSDFSTSLYGTGYVDSDGKLSIDVTTKIDSLTEGEDNFWLEVYSTYNDYYYEENAKAISSDISVSDSSKTYTITPSASTKNEGDTLITTITTTELSSYLYWSISGSGISFSDFTSGSTTGYGYTGYDGNFTFTHTLKNDSLTEGDETLKIKLFTDSYRSNQVGETVSVIIKDTSKASTGDNVIYTGMFSDYKFYNRGDGKYEIKTDSGYDDITGLKLTFLGESENSSFRDISTTNDIKGTFDQVTGLNTDSGRMFRLYNASFKRLPDPNGLAYWINNFSSGRNTIRVVASSFLGSEEFTQRYGDNVSDSTFVNTLYKNVLGREADTSGLNYWLGQLTSGAETRYEALLGFAESAENKTLFSEMTGFD